MLGSLMTPEPSLAILHISINTFPPHTRVVLVHLFMTAKLSITKLQNYANQLSFSDTLPNHNHQCKMEKLLLIKKFAFLKCYKQWSIWLSTPTV